MDYWKDGKLLAKGRCIDKDEKYIQIKRQKLALNDGILLVYIHIFVSSGRVTSDSHWV